MARRPHRRAVVSAGEPPGPGRTGGQGPDSNLTRREVAELVVGRLAEVLAVRRSTVTMRANLAGDLHADSLDLVEAVESIEQSLRARGHAVRVPESELAAWSTVGDAVDGFAEAAGVGDG